MRCGHKSPCKQGDVIETRGTGNAPGAGGVISTVIVTDKNANGRVAGIGGYKCRDATPAEIKEAKASGKFRIQYCS
jgi:hypothetical protein